MSGGVGTFLARAWAVFWIAVALLIFAAVVIGRVHDWRERRRDVRTVRALVQSDVPLYDRLAAEMGLDPIDPAAMRRIHAAVDDELAARRRKPRDLAPRGL